MKQVQAVVNAVTEVLGDSFTENSTVILDVITKEQKDQVREIVFNGIIAGDVAYKGSLEDETVVQKYVNGMVDNHLRKSKLLNGGTAYKASKSGTKRDPQLRELNKLLGTLEEGTEDYTRVEAFIAERTTKIAAERSAKSLASSRAKIDTSVLPEHLVELLQNSEG